MLKKNTTKTKQQKQIKNMQKANRDDGNDKVVDVVWGCFCS